MDRVTIRFRVLGSFEVMADDRPVTPSAPKLRQALALMVMEHNKTVSTHTLIDELWGEAPPRQAARTVHTYIYELRRALHSCGADGTLVTRPNGYMAVVANDRVDTNVADALVRRAAAALAGRDPDTARHLLVEALALWRGRPLSNVSWGKLLGAFATRLEESWLQALELRIEADLQLNRHREVVGELKALTANHQFHEGMHGKLMIALYRCGRRTEALDVYRSLHRRLAEEIGLGPGSQIQQLQQRVLVADPTLEPQSVQRTRPASGPAIPPAQLPPDITDFTGRQDPIATVRTLLETHRHGSAMPLVSITGMPGVGKTTTAVRIAHAIRRDFPDGQLFVGLGGSSGAPEQPAQVLALFLHSAGIAADLRDGLPDRVAAFRTWTSTRRVLLVLDDADSVDQIVPLLPTGAGCAAIVTNRFPLYGLPVTGAVRLGAMDVDEGVELLSQVVGRDRVACEPAAAADTVRLVGGLPLAIRFLGQRLASVPGQRLDQFAARLSGTSGRRRLSDLGHVGADLRARLEASYRKLVDRDRSAFRLLAALPGNSFTAREAAEVFLVDDDTAEMTLLRLADAQLVQMRGEDRFSLHELVRPYTLECVASQPAPA